LNFTLTSVNGLYPKINPYISFRFGELLNLINFFSPCPQGWSIVDLGGGVYTLRDTVGILDCVSNLTLTNEEVSIINPGENVVQCLQLETDPECGSNLGICFNATIEDIGLPDDYYLSFGPVRFCSNADTLTNLLSCNQCF